MKHDKEKVRERTVNSNKGKNGKLLECAICKNMYPSVISGIFLFVLPTFMSYV